MKLIKNKKGSAVIEMLIILPVLIYVIIFAIAKVSGLVAYSNIQKNSVYLVNEVVVEKDAKSALDRLSQIVVNEGIKDSITSIKIIKNMNSNFEPLEYEITFGINKLNSRNSFLAYSSSTSFNWNSYYANNETSASLFEANWEQEAIIEITLERDLISDVFGSLLDYKYYNVESGKWETAPFIVDTALKVSSSGLLEN